LDDAAVDLPLAQERVQHRADIIDRDIASELRFAGLGVVRGEVYGSEYLGTTQIVTVTTRYGTLKARSPASVSFRTGEHVGLDFRPDTLSIFDKASGRSVRTALHEGGTHG